MERASQLYRYFSVTDARFGVLTDGIIYKFYSDLESSNKMDSLPFYEFDIRVVTEDAVDQLKRFSKEAFDLEGILSTATDLKYTKAIKRIITEEWQNPSEDLVRLLAGRVYEGRLTQSARDQFTVITKKALHEFVSERVNQRLKNALKGETEEAEAESETEEPVMEEIGIVTTEEEIDGFNVVRSIIREVADVKRVFMRDTKSYCGILLDDNNRKPICRLIFNNPRRKQLAIFDKGKSETRHAIEDVSDIYRYADQIKATVLKYEGKGPETE